MRRAVNPMDIHFDMRLYWNNKLKANKFSLKGNGKLWWPKNIRKQVT